jgi:hypothetical protein
VLVSLYTDTQRLESAAAMEGNDMCGAWSQTEGCDSYRACQKSDTQLVLYLSQFTVQPNAMTLVLMWDPEGAVLTTCK